MTEYELDEAILDNDGKPLAYEQGMVDEATYHLGEATKFFLTRVSRTSVYDPELIEYSISVASLQESVKFWGLLC